MRTRLMRVWISGPQIFEGKKVRVFELYEVVVVVVVVVAVLNEHASTYVEKRNVSALVCSSSVTTQTVSSRDTTLDVVKVVSALRSTQNGR